MRLLAQRAAAGLPCPALACADLAWPCWFWQQTQWVQVQSCLLFSCAGSRPPLVVMCFLWLATTCNADKEILQISKRYHNGTCCLCHIDQETGQTKRTMCSGVNARPSYILLCTASLLTAAETCLMATDGSVGRSVCGRWSKPCLLGRQPPATGMESLPKQPRHLFQRVCYRCASVSMQCCYQ
jgi:hypothetical protein